MSAPGPAIARGALIVAAGSAAAALGAFATRWLMARALAPNELGDVTLAIAAVSAAGGLGALGTSASAARAVAAARARRDSAAAHRAAGSALRLALAGGAAGLLVVGCGIPLGLPGTGRALLARLFAVVGPAALAIALGSAVFGISRGWSDVLGRAGLRDGGGGLLRFAGVATAVLVMRDSVGGVSAAWIAAGWAVGTVCAESLFILWARVRRYWIDLRAPWPAWREQRPYALMGALLQAAQWSDVLLLGAVAPRRAVGLYGVARGIGRVLEIVTDSAAHRFLPAATAVAVRGGPEAIAPLYRRTRALIAALVVPLAAVLLAAPVSLLEIAFGDDYVAAAGSLRWLTAGLLVSVLAGYNDKALLALDRASAVWRGLGSGVAAGAAVTLIAAPRWGAVGAAVGYAVMQAVQNGSWSRAARRSGVEIATGWTALAGWLGGPIVLALLLVGGRTEGLNLAWPVGVAAIAGSLGLLAREVVGAKG